VNNDCFYVGTEDLLVEESLSFIAIGNNIFQSSSQVNNLKVQLYSIEGKLTFSHSGSNEFHVNASPGIYFLVFQSEKQSGVQKISIR
jgi:hypothetical protein